MLDTPAATSAAQLSSRTGALLAHASTVTRLDQTLVERGLCDSREKAKRAILAGQVTINQHPAAKPSDPVKPEDIISLLAAERFVSRGGYKLEHALDHFQVKVSGQTAIDLGASTGGFTDCLLKNGAARVYAIDVGYGQLAHAIATDPRVVVLERQNIRTMARERVPEPIALAVVDVSFISLALVFPAIDRFLVAGAAVVAGIARFLSEEGIPSLEDFIGTYRED